MVAFRRADAAAMPPRVAPDTPLEALPLAVVDLETTGLYAESGDRVCEIAVLCASADGPDAAWSTLVDPGRPIAPGASAVNGIRDADVAGAPRFAAVAGELLARLDGHVLVAHNAAFDLSFLAHELADAGVAPPDLPAICTLTLARRRFRFRSNALGSVAAALGVRADGAHRAAADALTTLGVWRHMVPRLRALGLRTLADVERAQGGALRIGHTRGPQLPEPLATALREGRPVVIRYGDGSRAETVRVIRPRAAGRGMLVAFCHLRGDERTFRVDRIVEARWPRPDEVAGAGS